MTPREQYQAGYFAHFWENLKTFISLAPDVLLELWEPAVALLGFLLILITFPVSFPLLVLVIMTKNKGKILRDEMRWNQCDREEAHVALMKPKGD